MKKILALDGSLQGRDGNTAAVLLRMAALLESHCSVDYIELKSVADPRILRPLIDCSSGFIFGTGTYWQSWGSPLQRFFEAATEWEATSTWLGKPASVAVTMHSVGGLEVLGRIQSNLSMFGLLIPPHSCVLHSEVAQLARTVSGSDDIWDLQCLPTVCKNLLEAVQGTHQYEPWEVDRSEVLTKLWVRK